MKIININEKCLNGKLYINIILFYILKSIIILLHCYIISFFFKNKKEISKNFNDCYSNIKTISKLNYIYQLDYENKPLDLMFNLALVNYSFSYKFHMAKISFNIAFYNQNKDLIIPSDLTLNYKLSILCQSNEIGSNTFVRSLANIDQNKYYNCIEFFNINEKIKLGIRIYKIDKYFQYSEYYLFTNNIFVYNDIFYLNDSEYDPFILINKHINLERKIDTQTSNTIIPEEPLLLKKSYISMPNFSIKMHFARKEEIWYIKNIYNNYFCFCKCSFNTTCLYHKISRNCKYKLYLNIIDINRYLYNKTDYLLADFSSPDTAPCEAYLIFKEMFNQNLNVHFMTQREDIFKIFNKFNYIKKIPIIYGSNYIDGDFLEKYLNIFLRLKATISGAKIYSYNNLFYNIEYITYICLGHGISYLKDFLYEDYYSNKIYNKIVLPNSDIIISNAMKYGWTEDNIIKIGLPRWDIFYNYEKNFQKEKELTTKNNSIFVMFTWRDIKKYKNISKYYFKNIFNLINNSELYKNLELYNTTLYFTLHHNMKKLNNFLNNKKFIKYIDQEQILECLTISDLIITDFSSIIFDIMIRFKPYIIYIPDSEDPKLNNIYNKTYFEIINGMKNGTIKVENKFFNLYETINKTIFYIKNNFKLEPTLTKFYKSYNLEGGENIKNLIYYLKNLQ